MTKIFFGKFSRKKLSHIIFKLKKSIKLDDDEDKMIEEINKKFKDGYK